MGEYGGHLQLALRKMGCGIHGARAFKHGNRASLEVSELVEVSQIVEACCVTTCSSESKENWSKRCSLIE